jgi:WD40 repeat protein
MARQVLPIVGAVVGAYFGNPALGYAVGAAIGNAVDPLVVQGPKIGDTAIQTSAEGAYRAIVYGTAAVAGNLIWTGPKIIRKEKEQAAKGGGPVTEYERLFQSFAIRICEGPISGILRIWEDEKLVYDVREGSTIPADTTKFASRFVLHLGGEDQLPDSEIESVMGIGNAPAYRGSAYIVFPKADLTDRRGSIPQYRFEVVSRDADITWSPKIISRSAFFTGTLEDLTPHPDSTFATVRTVAKKGIALSPDGLTAAGIFEGAPYLRAFTYDRDSDTFTPLTVSGSLPSSSNVAVLFSQDGKWLAVAGEGAPKINVFQVTSAGLVFHSSLEDASSGNPVFAAFSPANNDLAVLFDTNPKIRIYRFSEGVPVYRLNQSPAFSTFVDRLAWEPNGGRICAGSSGTFAAWSLGQNPMQPAIVDATAVAGANCQRGLHWSGFLDFIYMVGIGVGSNNLTVFRLLNDGDNHYTMQRYPDPVQVPFLPFDSALSADRRHLVVGGSTGTPSLAIYRTNLMQSLALTNTASSGSNTSFAINEGLSVGSGTALPGTLGAIVADIAARCGMDAADVDVSELEDQVDGFVLAGSYTGASAINALRAPYFFDASEYDKAIHFVKRGKAVIRTLTFDDLVDEPESATREDAREFPAKLHLEYQNSISGYETAKATSARSSTDIRVTGETSVSVPVVMDSTVAQQTVVKLHKVAWADQEGEIPLTVSDKHLDLVAADNVGLALRGTVSRLRIEKLEHAAGEIKLTCRHDRQSAYSANVTGVPLPTPTPPPSSIVGATQLAILDIPALVDINDLANPVEYAAMSGITDAWFGATLQRSVDGGSTFGTVLQDPGGTVMGTLVQGVAAASEYYRDRTNRVVVALSNPSDVLEDLSESAYLSEGGAFALETPAGGWEILQYKDVEEASDGNWVLSDLLRGRLNTTPSEHMIGARFVLLSGVKLVNVTSGLIGQVVVDRAVSSGESPESAAQQSHTVTAQSQREWPVASLRLSRSSGSITATWAARHRFGTEVNPIASINFQGFRVTANDGVLPPITQDTTNQSITIDASSLGPSVVVSVAAINRITGPGPAVSETI